MAHGRAALVADLGVGRTDGGALCSLTLDRVPQAPSY